ncbi:AbrB/MazE/SpoVT family DNA-binding domain-containing protein [Sphingomonas radiodurans]|uniref:AbrB/MazE/SpoVT family DNA-binding domain-containing protein n=1 Tax=Sphingomonas radiodurans TaxID=2890321 RepID=UPI001E3AEE07|nr:AbrB/MazE/SpoVT family DNA-binding domain-containing protein [Sphingomonas radiodurans]WBH17265.1 AbrB/MazE/SpoVT family DNA-binding domain-containing protein [Sphingomonas radiodurans]
MTTLTITAKGQITLKKELLRHLGLGPGDKLDVQPVPGGGFTMRPATNGRRTIEDSIGALKRPGQKTLSIEEMNDVIAQAWAGER